MPEDETVTPIKWLKKADFRGRSIRVDSIGRNGKVEIGEPIPVPDDEIICDACNEAVEEFPCAVVGSYALCPDCRKRWAIEPCDTEYFESAAYAVGEEPPQAEGEFRREEAVKFYLARNPGTDHYEPFFHLRFECACSSGVEVEELDGEGRRQHEKQDGIYNICSKCSRDFISTLRKADTRRSIDDAVSSGKVYEGRREVERISYENGHAIRMSDRFVVTVNGERLDPRFDLVNHSPDGFAWGYGGSGPAQLAFAILCDLYGEDMARNFYQDFKWKVVNNLPQDWRLTEASIFAAILEIQDERTSRPPEEEPSPPVVLPAPTVVPAPKKRRRQKNSGVGATLSGP